MNIFKIIKNEIEEYTTKTIQISEGYSFSQYSLVRRIMLYANCIYPSGKIDSKGDYKYWYDIITPRIESEVKNIDFDRKDVQLYSDKKRDNLLVFLSNGAMQEWMREEGQAEKFNDAVEDGAGWGNIVWKKVKGGYEQVDLKNFYVINQSARTLDDTTVIERHLLNQSDLRAKKDVWKNVEETIKDCGEKEFATTIESIPDIKQAPYYEIFERNGEVSEKDLFEAMEKEGGDKDKYILAKIITAGITKDGKGEKYILYADEIKEMPYKEYHRGRYTGRWFRRGLYEILFDVQTRANEIGNQIARGLVWASKAIFRSADRLIVQNILTDLDSGAVIKATDLAQVDTRMHGIDQLIADWNRLMVEADRLSHSMEVVRGETMPSGTPFRLGKLLDINVGKFFEFIREKMGLAFQSIFEEWILSDLLRDLKGKDILRLTGSPKYLRRFYEMVVDSWYLRNLIAMAPHTPEQADIIKQAKLQELLKRPDALVKNKKEMWEGFKPRCRVLITGESVNVMEKLETLQTFLQFEMDPGRRAYLLDLAYNLKGFDIGDMPEIVPPAPEVLAPAEEPGVVV